MAELATETKLPRPTIYRLIETLATAGYILVTDGRCQLAATVRDLAYGYVEAGWVRDVARPHLNALGGEVLWPVMLATCALELKWWRARLPNVIPRSFIGATVLATESQ